MIEEYTKESLIRRLDKIKDMGWILETEKREKNQGGPGNTLEDLLGIEENNFPLPDIGEWELKTHKVKSTALLTLAHHEPEPRDKKVVPNYLLPNFGWPHKQAGKKYPETEKSFRQTINSQKYSDRGFKINVDYTQDKVKMDFDSMEINDSSQMEYKVMLEDRFEKPIEQIKIDPEYDPYWDFEDLNISMEKKLKNTFLVEYMERKTEKGKEVKYVRVLMLEDFQFDNYLKLLNDKNSAFVDFDARTGHNHGTKFRIRKNLVPLLYKKHEVVVE